MRLLLNYKGINKIMSKVDNYSSIVQFVHENFFLKMSKWTLTYIDSDGDSIALDSDLDVQTMLDTCTRDHLKVYIKDIESAEEINIEESATSNIASESQKEETYIPEKAIQIKVEDEEQVEPVPEQEKKEEPIPEIENQPKDHCRWKQMWRKKMEQKMAKFVDERVESLIPCLAKQIEEKIYKNEPKVMEEQSGVIHEEKCKGCGISPIVGIRYKCTKCVSFNFCEACEATISHDHNMIKMRYLEEPQKVDDNSWERNCRWWKRNHCSKVGDFSSLEDLKEIKEQDNDKSLRLTRKCFRLAKFFGEKPQKVREFVKANIDVKFNELTQLYITRNGESVIRNEETQKKLEERAEKLAFYFNEDKEKFISLVRKMPSSNLKQLIKVIQDERKSEIAEVEKIEEKAQVSEKSEELQIQEIKPELEEKKEEQKKEQQKPKESKTESLPVCPPLPPPPSNGFWGIFKKPPPVVDVKKKNECIILMKDYFGPEKVYDYIKFFDENSELSQEEIIAKYIQKMTQ